MDTDNSKERKQSDFIETDNDNYKAGWNIGFAIMTFIVLAILVYTLSIRDMTPYQLSILLISLYTMGTMAICLPFSFKKGEQTEERPFVSILVPAKNEELVIENTVRSLFQIDYKKEDGTPNYEVIIIDDNSTDSTLSILNGLKEEFPTLIPLHRESGRRGKSAVLNFAVNHANGEYIAVFDADTIVEKDFLTKTMKYFSSDKVAGVQGRVKIFNKKENLLARLQDYEFTIYAHMLQLSKAIFGGIMQLSGNGQIVRKTALLDVGGWNEMSATDDQDLTIKFLLNGTIVRYVPDAVIWQEAITNIWPLIRQRIRWAEGMFRCIYEYFFPVMLHKKLTLIQKIDGLSGLMRIVATLIVLIGYVQLATLMVFPTLEYYTCDPIAQFSNIFMLFFFAGVMIGGLLKFYDKFEFMNLIKFPIYWFYNTIWLIATPIGYFNSIRNKNTIKWDKTEHKVKEINIESVN